MPEPKTLLDMAGVPNRPHRLAEAAVVMIDAQMEYVNGRLPLTGIEPALEVGAELLAAARTAGRPVLHVQHQGKGDGLFGPDSADFAIAPQVAPRGARRWSARWCPTRSPTGCLPRASRSSAPPTSSWPAS